MSFFGSGFDTSHDLLNKEKEKFMESGLGAQEDVAVYTWGDSDYDGLGDALQEGGDELNDETFGGSGPVGKDFDFSSHGFPVVKQEENKHVTRREYQDSLLHGKAWQAPRTPGNSLESIWDDKSPSSVLISARSTGRSAGVDKNSLSSEIERPQPSSSTSGPGSGIGPTSISSQQGVRTLQEIETEMRAKQSQQNCISSTSPSLHNHVSRMSPRLTPVMSTNHTFPSNSAFDAGTQLTPEEVEHQLRMMHLSQLQHLQAQRQEHQQPIYQSIPSSYQKYLRTPEQIFAEQSRIQRSYPNTPEPRYPIHHLPQGSQSYLTQRQQHQLFMQQQLLAQLSQAGVMPDQIHLLDPVQREAIMNEAMRKIMAAERLDQKNRRRLIKMERMARYNDLMTQSDKDFITRIQVSQLVTADPYTEDFYAQVFGSLRRNGMGIRGFGNAGAGLGVPGHRLGGRREHAMNRMAEQVYRIVENAKAREKEKDQHGGFNPLQGVLGKTSGRSYKAAPRQLLQVDSAPVTGSPASSPKLHEAEAAKPEDKLDTFQNHTKMPPEHWPPISPTTSSDPLSDRQALVIIEKLFDYALDWENNRRVIPEEGTGARQKWEEDQMYLEARMWEASQVTAPLEARYPHPLVSILRPLKGKKVMKRLTRIMDSRQLRITMTLVTRLFRDFDVVQNYHVSETPAESKEKQEMERHIHVFEEFVLEAILPALAVAPLPVVSGQLQHLRDPVAIAQTRPGIILLTHIFTRAAIIRDRTLSLRSGAEIDSGMTQDDVATFEDFQDWQARFDELFENLAPHLLSLFPSTRIAASLPFEFELPTQTSLALDAADQPVWSFFASMAVPATMEQQQILVTQLREKVLENVLSANKGWVADEAERNMKLRNVNIFLHALGLDSSQIAL